MSQDLQSLLDEIRSDLTQMPTMLRVYESVPDALNDWPACVVAGMSCDVRLVTHDSTMASTWTIRVDIHVPRKDLPVQAVEMTYLAHEANKTLMRGFVTDRFNGTLITTGTFDANNNATPPIAGVVGPSSWNGQQTYAYMCDFRVSIEDGLLDD